MQYSKVCIVATFRSMSDCSVDSVEVIRSVWRSNNVAAFRSGSGAE